MKKSCHIYPLLQFPPLIFSFPLIPSFLYKPSSTSFLIILLHTCTRSFCIDPWRYQQCSKRPICPSCSKLFDLNMSLLSDSNCKLSSIRNMPNGLFCHYSWEIEETQKLFFEKDCNLIDGARKCGLKNDVCDDTTVVNDEVKKNSIQFIQILI